jgi:hypothetical protein
VSHATVHATPAHEAVAWVTPVAQVVAVSHCPLVLHVCSCVPLAHCVVPGTHDPPQPPPTTPMVPTQASAQVVGAAHCPVASHVAT